MEHGVWRDKKSAMRSTGTQLATTDNGPLTTDNLNGFDEASTEDFGCDCCGGGGVSLDIGVVVRA